MSTTLASPTFERRIIGTIEAAFSIAKNGPLNQRADSIIWRLTEVVSLLEMVRDPKKVPAIDFRRISQPTKKPDQDLTEGRIDD